MSDPGKMEADGSFAMGIAYCARCGGDHSDLAFGRLTRPMVYFAPPNNEAVTWTHWAPCPVNGEPIMLRMVVSNVA